MRDPNKAVVRRFVEEFQAGGRRDVGEELLAADFRNRTPMQGAADDRNAVLETFAMLRTILPDIRIEMHDMLADGDRVATRKTFHGTIPGLRRRRDSGRTVVIDVIDVVRLRDGRIVEHWNSIDRLTLVRQLGVAGIARIVLLSIVAMVRRRIGGTPATKDR